MSSYVLTVPGRTGNTQIIYENVACAGAISSLIWNGIEFVNRGDDGRCIQSALTTDNNEEDYNPTEGGSLKTPGFGTRSDSRCVEHELFQGKGFRTLTQMALWKTGALSDFDLSKRVSVLDNVATFDQRIITSATLARPIQDKWEILTGYMPPVFSLFLALDRDAGSVKSITAEPGEIAQPVILAKPDGSAAMGALAPAWGNGVPAGCGYGRWQFAAQGCVKWNVVRRYPAPALAAVHEELVNVAWGTLADVVAALATPRGVQAGRVRRLYWATLDRAPDAEGMAFCLSWLGTGAQLADLAAGFIASPEFQAKYGAASNGQFITLLYANVLGRAPDAAGMAYYLDQLAGGVSRAAIVVSFSESPEFQIRRLLLDA